MKNTKINIETENTEIIEEFTPEQYEKACKYIYPYITAFDCLLKNEKLECDLIVHRLLELVEDMQGQLAILEEEPGHEPEIHWMVDYFQLKLENEYQSEVIELFQQQLKAYEKGAKNTEVNKTFIEVERVLKSSNAKPQNSQLKKEENHG